MKTAVGGLTIRWIGQERGELDDPLEFTPSMLDRRANRFASALERHGVPTGAVVATLIGRVPDLYVAALGTDRARCVFVALDVNDGPTLIAEQLRTVSANVIITAPTLFRRTVSPVLDRLPDADLVLVCGASEDQTARAIHRHGPRPDVMSCGAFLSRGTEDFDGAPSDPGAPAQWLVPAGSPSRPEVRTRRDAAERHQFVRGLLDAHDVDTYWCTADRGWPAGVTDGVGATLAAGTTSIVDEADFDATRSLHILRHQHVQLLHTSVAALRQIRQAAAPHADVDAPFDLRVVAAVGDRLDPATGSWAQDYFQAPILEVRSTHA